MNQSLLPIFLILLGAAIHARQQTPINTKPIDGYILLDHVFSFDPVFPSAFGSGGRQIAFRDTGAYAPVFVRPRFDSVRGGVAEIVFPPTRSSGQRGISCYLPPDRAITRIRFAAKRLSGGRTITVSLYSSTIRKHFDTTITLTDTWQDIGLPLVSFTCRETKGMRCTGDMITALIFFVAEENPTAFLIDDVVTETGKTGEQAVCVIRRLRQSPWCFSPHVPFALAYLVSSTVGGQAEIAIDIDGNEARRTVYRTDVVEGSVSINVPHPALDEGYYSARVTLRLVDGKGAGRCDSISDSWIVCAGNPSTLFGCTVSPYVYSSGQLKSLAAAGFGWIRSDEFRWSSIEPLKKEECWTHIDSLVAWTRSAGLRLLPVLQGAPGWILPPPPGVPGQYHDAAWIANLPPVDIKLWAAWVGRVTSRYCGKIDAWEIWNEPDWNAAPPYFFWGNRQKYFRLLSSAYNSIKHSCPLTRVVSGGISKMPGKVDQEFTSGMLADATVRMDVFGFHAYGDIESSLRILRMVRQRKPKTPLWNTEVGAKWKEDSPTALTVYGTQFFRWTFAFLAAGVEHWSIYWVHPRFVNDGFSEALLNANGSPTAQLALIATTSRLIHDARTFTILHGSASDPKIVTWHCRNGYVLALAPSTPAKVRSNADITLIDAFGSVIKRYPSGVVTVSDQALPLFLISAMPISLN